MPFTFSSFESAAAFRDRARRQHLIEGSFAQAANHHHLCRLRLAGHSRDGAVLGDRHLCVRRNGDRPRIAHHVQPVARLQNAFRGQLQSAVACVGLVTIGVLHRNPAFAIDGNIELASGALYHTRREISARCRIDHECACRQTFADQRHTAECVDGRAKSRRVDVGQILRHRCLLLHGVRSTCHRGVDQPVHFTLPALIHLTQVDDRLQYLILCLDRLRIGLINALCSDHVHQLGGQVDIGVFSSRRLQHAQA